MNRRIVAVFFLSLGMLLPGLGAPAGKELNSSAPAGCDSARVRFRLAEKTLRPSVTFRFGNGETRVVQPAAKDVTMDAVYVEYRQRRNWEKANGPVPKKTYANVAVSFDGLGLDWYCLPNPHYYDIPVPTKTLLDWEKTFPDALKAEMTLEARREGEDVAWYVNGQYAGRAKGARYVRSVAVRDAVPVGKMDGGLDDLSLEDNGPSFTTEWFKADPPSAFVTLPSRGRMHASRILSDGQAKLSVGRGLQTVGGVVMNVLAPEESVDIARHRPTCSQVSLFDNPYFQRTAYHPCPEFAQWCVPNAFYATAWVLCADVPQPGREPFVGTHLTRFGGQGSTGMAFGRQDLAGAREVGTLEWTEGGTRKTAPLRLVRVDLSLGRILDLVNDKAIYADGIGWKKLHRLPRVSPQVDDYLDFELDGGGNLRTPSSVQVFGVTLERAPFGAEMIQSEFGNLFHNDEKPETGVEVTALADGTKGSVDAVVYDESFRILSTNTLPFAIAKAGEKAVLRFGLAQKELGWYGLDFVFRDARGVRLFTHEAAFALLGTDTREAGYDSPYAAWPHNGRHNSQPHLEEVAKKMHKLGLRKSWEPPGTSEDEPQMKKYSITKSILTCCQPCAPCGAETLAKELDARVAEARESLAKFPHMSKCIQLLHERGGRELAPEMLYKPAVRGAYKGIEGDWEVYFCTEFCKRMRKEFPDFDIMIGNGSSASEKIASLCRNGFDLNLVTQLGIESKGFGTMPEECANLEAPGMLWALRETGRRFGYTNFTMNACNEYVFRPERDIPRTASRAERRRVTDFYLRDYLVSLLHGVRCICTSHLEDSKTNYYNTNWGAGCLSKTYPYAYPKRCLVAIATLTKVLDCVERSPRRVPTGEVATYAFEWRRNRRVKDYASAYWTPSHDAKIRVFFPAGTKIEAIDWQGKSAHLPTTNSNLPTTVTLTIGSTPVYLVTSQPAERAEVVEHVREKTDGFVRLAEVNTSTVEPMPLTETPESYPMVGSFAHADVTDPELGQTLSATLAKRVKPLPEVVWEYERLQFRKPVAVDPRAVDAIGLWVKGNGAFGGVEVVLADPEHPERTRSVPLGYRNKITFHGWHFLSGRIPAGHSPLPAKLVVKYLSVGSAACALDPREMVPVTEPVGVGPLMAKACAGKTAAVELTQGEIQSMTAAPDRDLAGRQLGRGKASAQPEQTASAPATYAFSSNMVTFLTKETREKGFAQELKNRLLAAWRRDPENAFKAKRTTFATDDALVVALTAWVGPGLPEAKPKRHVRHAGKILEIREFAEELRSAPPTFEVPVPEGVFSCVRRGEKGKNSICFFNLNDKPVSFTLWVPKDCPTKYIDLLTGKIWSSPTHGWYGFWLNPRDFCILRSNSGLPGKDSSDDESVIELDD